LGWNPKSDTILDVAAQVAWIQILFKVCDEAILQPLYFCFGKNLDNREVMKNRLVTGLIIAASVYLLFGGILALICGPISDRMAQVRPYCCGPFLTYVCTLCIYVCMYARARGQIQKRSCLERVRVLPSIF
jgi:MFS family permease